MNSQITSNWSYCLEGFLTKSLIFIDFLLRSGHLTGVFYCFFDNIAINFSLCTDLYEAEVNHKEEKKMKKKTLALVLAFTMTAALFTGGGSKNETETTQPQTETAAETESEEVDDQAAADEVATLIDAIYVQTRNENTDEQCAAAKAAWDKLTDAQKELVD